MRNWIKRRRFGEPAQRVDLGEDWLDRNVPGWASKVSLERLDMESAVNCVLARSTGLSYFGAVRQYLLTPEQAQRLGFMAFGTGRARDREWDALNSAWASRIYARQLLAS